VPEGTNQWPLADGFLSTFFVRKADTQRGPDQPDKPISQGDDHAKNNSLAQGEAVWTGHCLDSGWRFAGAGFGHEPIVMGWITS
jgi:hypothetical protein